jgi:hypothetical protein
MPDQPKQGSSGARYTTPRRRPDLPVRSTCAIGEIAPDVPAPASALMAEVERLRAALLYERSGMRRAPVQLTGEGPGPLRLVEGQAHLEAARRGGARRVAADIVTEAELCDLEIEALQRVAGETTNFLRLGYLLQILRRRLSGAGHGARNRDLSRRTGRAESTISTALRTAVALPMERVSASADRTGTPIVLLLDLNRALLRELTLERDAHKRFELLDLVAEAVRDGEDPAEALRSAAGAPAIRQLLVEDARIRIAVDGLSGCTPLERRQTMEALERALRLLRATFRRNRIVRRLGNLRRMEARRGSGPAASSERLPVARSSAHGTHGVTGAGEPRTAIATPAPGWASSARSVLSEALRTLRRRARGKWRGFADFALRNLRSLGGRMASLVRVLRA